MTTLATDCRYIVLGCGHTGTTLISGLLHINGYGSFKISSDFENIALNSLNQRILDGALVNEAEIRDFIGSVERRTRGRWSLKDPRLSETIPRFYPYVPRPVKFILNYRHPGATVRSLIKDRQLYESHLSPKEMLRSAEDEWLRRNRSALKFLDDDNESPVLFVHYDDLVDRMLDDMLCRFIGRSLDLSFIAPSKRRSAPMPVRQELLTLYDELIQRTRVDEKEILRTTETVPTRRRRTPTLRTRQRVLANRIVNHLRWRRDTVRRLIRKGRTG